MFLHSGQSVDLLDVVGQRRIGLENARRKLFGGVESLGKDKVGPGETAVHHKARLGLLDDAGDDWEVLLCDGVEVLLPQLVLNRFVQLVFFSKDARLNTFSSGGVAAGAARKGSVCTAKSFT